MCNCVSQVQCYDPETNSWLLRANIPIAKRCITAVSLNNLIYVCGGLTKSIFCYDPAEDYWIHVVQTFNKQVIDEVENLGLLNNRLLNFICRSPVFAQCGSDFLPLPAGELWHVSVQREDLHPRWQRGNR